VWEPGGGRWPQGCKGGVRFGSGECTHTHKHKWEKEIEREQAVSATPLRPRTQSRGHLWGFKDLWGSGVQQLSDGDNVRVTCPWLSGKGIYLPTQSAKNNNQQAPRLQSVCVDHDTSLNQDSHRKWVLTTGPQSLQSWGCPGRCQAMPRNPRINRPNTPPREHCTLLHSHTSCTCTCCWQVSSVTSQSSLRYDTVLHERFLYLTPGSPLPVPYEPLHTPAHRCDHYQANRKSLTGNWKLIPQLRGDGLCVLVKIVENFHVALSSHNQIPPFFFLSPM